MIGKFIDFKAFIISLAFGLFFVYLYRQDSTVIYVYPTPENIDKLNIKDKADNCFKFEISEMVCPSNAELINNIPVQN